MQQEFGRSLDELRNIVSYTDTFFAENDIDASVRFIVDLCVEELFVNMITYNTESNANILIEMNPHEHGVEISLTDFDVERFDPRDIGSVDVDAPLEQRTPGGLGLGAQAKSVSSRKYDNGVLMRRDIASISF